MRTSNSHLTSVSVDFEFWKRAAFWTIEEGAALVLGLDPNHVPSGDQREQNDSEIDLERFEKLVDLGLRAQKVNRLPDYPSPTEYLEWVSSIDYVALPDEFQIDVSEADFFSGQLFGDGARLDASFVFIDYKLSYQGLEKLFIENSRMLEEYRRGRWELLGQWQDSEEGDRKASTFEERQRKTMLKILLSVAIEKYRYNPNMQRSSAAVNISSATQRCGLDVTDETIRDYIKSALAEFPAVRNLFD